MEGNFPKTGYVTSDFKLFYLHESTDKDFSYHYHDFHKILLFLNGNVGYAVEGRSYDLHPGDIILIPAGQIHRPVIRDSAPYERIILYLSPDYLRPERQEGFDLNLIFTAAASAGTNLSAVPSSMRYALNFHIRQLQEAVQTELFAAPLFQKAAVLSFLIWLTRIQKDGSLRYRDAAASNQLILTMLDDINQNLTADLSIDSLAEKYHLSRSYLMHLFKAETGFTILHYITEKRLFLASQQIKNGSGVTQACFSCGFSDYTSFYRAFTARFGVPPKEAKKLV